MKIPMTVRIAMTILQTESASEEAKRHAAEVVSGYGQEFKLTPARVEAGIIRVGKESHIDSGNGVLHIEKPRLRG